MPTPSSNCRTNNRSIKVLLADRESVFRLGLKRVFSREAGLRGIAQAGNAAQTLAMAKAFRPDLLVLQQEIATAERRSLVGAVLRQAPGCKIMITVSAGAENGVRHLLEEGASCFLPKSSSPEAFLEQAYTLLGARLAGRKARRTRRVAEQGNGSAPRTEGQRRPKDTLTQREKTIVSYLTHGWRNREIAARLEISEQTVKNHLRSIYDKLGVSDRLELALYAIHQKMDLPPVEPSDDAFVRSRHQHSC